MRGPADISPARLDWTLAVRSLFAWVGGAMRPQKQLPAKPGAPGVPSAIPADYYAAGPYVATRSQQTDALRLAILANPDALAAVAGIAREIAARPVIVRTEADPTPREHPVFALLDSAPGFTREQLVERLIADVLLTGNALVEVLGRPTPVTPRAGVLVLRDATDLYAELDRAESSVTAYRYEGPDGTRYIAPSNILHAAVNRYGTGQDGVFGVSPLAPLLPDFERAARDALFLRDRPRGTAGSVEISFPPGTETDAMMAAVRLIDKLRERTGYHIGVSGATFEGLPEPGDREDVLSLQNAMLDSIIRALGLAPVLWNRSVTNDSAAKEQHRAYRAMLHALSGVVWTAFQPLMDRLGSTDLYLASDWSGDAADAEIEDQERRAKLAEIHVRNGLPVATAYQLAGIDLPGATDATQSQGPRLLLAR